MISAIQNSPVNTPKQQYKVAFGSQYDRLSNKLLSPQNPKPALYPSKQEMRNTRFLIFLNKHLNILINLLTGHKY